MESGATFWRWLLMSPELRHSCQHTLFLWISASRRWTDLHSQVISRQQEHSRTYKIIDEALRIGGIETLSPSLCKALNLCKLVASLTRRYVSLIFLRHDLWSRSPATEEHDASGMRWSCFIRRPQSTSWSYNVIERVSTVWEKGGPIDSAPSRAWVGWIAD